MFDENKAFKIRLKSKKTNKTLDFNIKCKLKRVETEEEKKASELRVEPYTGNVIIQDQGLQKFLEQLEAENPDLAYDKVVDLLISINSGVMKAAIEGAKQSIPPWFKPK